MRRGKLEADLLTTVLIKGRVVTVVVIVAVIVVNVKPLPTFTSYFILTSMFAAKLNTTIWEDYAY